MLRALSVLALACAGSISVLALTLGEAIRTVSTAERGLEVAGELVWLPTDSDLPPHYRHQSVHHESRQRWASQLIDVISSSTSSSSSSSCIDLADPRLERLLSAAALPFRPDEAETMDESKCKKHASWILDAIQGLHAIVCRRFHYCCSERGHGFVDDCDEEKPAAPSSITVGPDFIEAVNLLIERASSLSDRGCYTLDQACRLYWSIRGIRARVIGLTGSSSAVEALESRLSRLPFDIVPLGLRWTSLFPEAGNDSGACVNDLVRSIPFSRDTIVTRRGTSVAERRGTAWLAEEGIGALAYSGKLMDPEPMPLMVERVMRAVEDRLSLTGGDGESHFFDCALCNHYTASDSACKFHTDPEHGTMWDRTTVVVAAGSDRKFAFKPIDTTWENWEHQQGRESATSTVAAASVHLFPGDLVVMKDSCNDDFYHAVHSGETDDDRVSLVLKRALDRNGKKGHGRQGQGRRSRRGRKTRRSKELRSAG